MLPMYLGLGHGQRAVLRRRCSLGAEPRRGLVLEVTDLDHQGLEGRPLVGALGGLEGGDGGRQESGEAGGQVGGRQAVATLTSPSPWTLARLEVRNSMSSGSVSGLVEWAGIV